MAKVAAARKAVAINPLKLSQPLGAALAFLGIKGSIPLFHGSQGCTAFAKVVLVRHFREAIPMSTTAMTEVETILGGEGNVEQAILTLVEKANPEIIGLLTTGLTETRGDDMQGILKSIRKRHPELDGLPIVMASTPDFKGSLQDGFATVVNSLLGTLPQPGRVKSNQVTILASVAFTPGDIQEVKDMVEAFGLHPIVVPDLSGSLDGHLGEGLATTTSGGTRVSELQEIGRSAFTLALGESMRTAAELLELRFGIPYQVFRQLTGLAAVDKWLMLLSQLSGRSVPERYRRQRRQLQDAMLDTHFFFGGKRIALALEPDLLWSSIHWLQLMGAEIHAACTTTRSPLLKELPVDEVIIGDLEDFAEAAQGADLLVGNSHTQAVALQLGVPLFRQGIPIFDRLGNAQVIQVGYHGTMAQLFVVGNLLMQAEVQHPRSPPIAGASPQVSG
ncbi:MAG: nitrogenase iron-molybdenum cofactor biosynthesis protein NifN [Synechococcaceae cyanobacterium SM2_3_1]|nr:nitrogenase iron-molybdenum cofactor biosynthesis protein NifN [Synechococcaceae cyanobacterium SM2_3_1]